MQTSAVARRRRWARLAAGLTLLGTSIMALTPSAAASSDLFAPRDEGLSVTETILLYVVAPAAIFAVVALLAVGPSLGRGGRHRPGEPIGAGPVWIDPAGAHGRAQASAAQQPPTSSDPDQGGVHAHW